MGPNVDSDFLERFEISVGAAVAAGQAGRLGESTVVLGGGGIGCLDVDAQVHLLHSCQSVG